MTTLAARRYATAEKTVQTAMYVMVVVGFLYFVLARDHLQPSRIITGALVFAVLAGAKIALGHKAKARS